MRTLALTLLASAALAAPSAASAATFINGTLSAAMIGVTSSTQVIGNNTTFSSLLTLVSSATGDYFPVTPSTSLTLASVTATAGSTVTFTSAFGDFSGTIDTVDNVTSGSIRSLTLLSSGVFTPAGVLSAYTATPATITFNYLQTGGWGAAVSGGFSLSSPPASAIPEPASWGMLIAGAAIAGAAARRRRVKVTLAA